jgi:hydrogenase maturation protein HypF
MVYLVKDRDQISSRVSVRGIVQGVGFRPFVFNLAERFSLKGWVLNDSSGVEISVEGPREKVSDFISALHEEAPPLAHIESVRARQEPITGYESFEIRHSERQQGSYQLVSPDIATCADCFQEIFYPSDRRYRYPFTNCTNCGPRFTIIADMPYDRPNTTMRVFPMCNDCRQEYQDPRNRRFHAQPNACPVCGPRLELVPSPERDDAYELLQSSAAGGDVIERAAALLQQGAILAIKGLGGFHLACDATNADAVAELRRRKRRPDKPFALMMTDLKEVRRYCSVTASTRELLTSPQCPIVLLPWHKDSEIAEGVAPSYRYLGVMLPYTPLHHILLRDVGRPLVMTSGNLTEEPIAADNDEARQRLGHLADAFVLHNRDIYARYDDSVWFVPQIAIADEGASENIESVPQPIRRARGYAPFPIKTPMAVEQILACGPEIKSTFCLTRDRYAFVSQHIGDMENLETLEHYQRTVDLFARLFRVEPKIVARDLHPDYIATAYAIRRAQELDVPCIPVQHHYAHLAACLADNEWDTEDGPVIGAIMDGTGYGADGQIWGGEWLVGDYATHRRVAHLQYLPLPGGDAATKAPWRIAFSYLYTLLDCGTAMRAVPEAISTEVTTLLAQQIELRLNTASTSSMGRLFDAVSALLGICTHTSYEAQAAIELESAATAATGIETRAYPFGIRAIDGQQVVHLNETMASLVQDMERGEAVSVIAWRFHRTVAEIIVQVCQRISVETGLETVVLSGGCFQNRILLQMTVPALRKLGFQVLLHHRVPCNDGCVSLGQALIAHFAQA